MEFFGVDIASSGKKRKKGGRRFFDLFFGKIQSVKIAIENQNGESETIFHIISDRF